MIPEKYEYLKSWGTPKHLRDALRVYGVREITGEDTNPIIMEWARDIQPFLGINYTNDDTPWCGVFVGYFTHKAGFTPPKICVRAKEWLSFGWESSAAKIGDVLVFNRRGGGHVGFYVGEDTKHYYVLGGNQSDAVNVKKLEKSRCIGVREPPYIVKPCGAKPKIIDIKEKTSYNEA